MGFEVLYTFQHAGRGRQRSNFCSGVPGGLKRVIGSDSPLFIICIGEVDRQHIVTGQQTCRVALNQIVEPEKSGVIRLDSGLFAQFAKRRLGKQFTRLNLAAGKCIVSSGLAMGTADHQVSVPPLEDTGSGDARINHGYFLAYLEPVVQSA